MPPGSARLAAVVAGSNSRQPHAHGRGLGGKDSRRLSAISCRRVEKIGPAQHPRQQLPCLSRSRKLVDGAANDDHQVVAGTQVGVQVPQCLARDTLQPIAMHGTAALAYRDDAIAVAGWIGNVRQIPENQWTVGNSPPARACRAHVAAAPQPKSSFHAVRAMTTRPPSSTRQLPCQTGRRAKAKLLAILRELVLFRDGKGMASLAPSPGQHGAAAAVGHACQEAKLADALDPLGLIRSLRHSRSPFPIPDRDD